MITLQKIGWNLVPEETPVDSYWKEHPTWIHTDLHLIPGFAT